MTTPPRPPLRAEYDNGSPGSHPHSNRPGCKPAMTARPRFVVTSEAIEHRLRAKYRRRRPSR
jgi:hypothetical protein